MKAWSNDRLEGLGKSFEAGARVKPLDEIKDLYYKTTRATVQRDLDRAIDLLKSMKTEEERERATVYMEGLAEMRKEWKGGKNRRTSDP